MKLIGNGPYDNHKADMMRDVKTLSREELRNELARLEEDDRLALNGSGDVSATDL